MTVHGQPYALTYDHADDNQERLSTSHTPEGEPSGNIFRPAREFTSEVPISGANMRTFLVPHAATGLFSQSYLEESVDREFAHARLHDDTVSLILLNIDHLQNFKDQCGTAATNILLQVISHLLKSHLRPKDVVCCYGAGRYAALMQGAPSSVARSRVEFLRRKLPSIRWCDNAQLNVLVTLSAGIASFPEHALTPPSLFQAAEMALRRAMHSACDRVLVTTAARQSTIRPRTNTE